VGGVTVRDTVGGHLLHESNHLPQLYVPLADLDAEGLERTEKRTHCPLGTGAQPADPLVAVVADRLGRCPAQVLLGWCDQRGIPVISKSIHRDRIAENAEVFDFELSAGDMENSTRSSGQEGPKRHSSANGGG
jgi:2,5-diketo-D-gluconate reductase A